MKLCRKANFAFQVIKYLSKRSNTKLGTHYPETYILDVEHPDYLDEALNDCHEVVASLKENSERNNGNKELWILKPSITDRADFVHIVDSLEGLRAIFGVSDDGTSDDEVNENVNETSVVNRESYERDNDCSTNATN